jgi:membrane-bound lytic murein transglycosylase B
MITHVLILITSITIRPYLIKQAALLLLLFFLFCATNGYASNTNIKAADLVVDNQLIDLTSVKYNHLFQELIEKHGFTEPELNQLFKDVSINRKVLQLMDKQWEAKPYHQYWPRFITPTVILKGKQYLTEHKKLFNEIESKFGVDREYIVAIWAIESRYGSNQGTLSVFKTLNTLFAAYPRRSDYFRKELIAFLKLCRVNGMDPLAIKGSYAGAIGQPQFMPTSYLATAVDFDHDNRADLINSPADIFASVANYLKKAGWTLDAPVYAEIGTSLNSQLLEQTFQAGRKGRVDWRSVIKIQGKSIPRPPRASKLSIIGLERSKAEGGGLRYVAGYQNFHAITEYNHSHKYAMVVSEMAEAF